MKWNEINTNKNTSGLDERINVMSKLTLNVNKEQFESRVVAALEGAMKSPLKKRKQQIVNAAMVQLLHGGNNPGQNEHNLDQFWSESPIETKSATLWVGHENYRHENTYEEDSSTVTGETEAEVKRKLYTNVLDDLAETIAISIDLPNLFEVILQSGSDYGVRFLEEIDKTIRECEEEDIVELLKMSCNEDLMTQEAIFYNVVSMVNIEGSHEIHEVEVDMGDMVSPKAPQVPETKSVTIHTIILTNKAEGEDSGIDNVDVESTLSAKEHDDRLLEIFRQYGEEESASFDKDSLIQNSVTQDVMSDMRLDDEDLEEMSYEEIIEWLCENGRPNILVGMLPEMTYGLVEVEVKYKQEEI